MIHACQKGAVTGASVVSKRNELACCECWLLFSLSRRTGTEHRRVVKKAMVRGVALLLQTAMVLGVPLALGDATTTSGRFGIAPSCGDLRVGEVSARLQNLVVTSELWLRTREPATLQVLSGRKCRLPGNTTFRVTSSQKGQVVAADQWNATCTFATGTDFRLLSGEVKVSCEQDKVTAEREMSIVTNASQGLPPSIPVHPEPRGLDFSIPGHTTAPVSERTSAGRRTKQNTDANEELPITTDITVEQGETTEASVTDAEQTTGDTTDTAASTGAIATTETSGNLTELQPVSKRKSPTQNSTSQTPPDHGSYLVGAGMGIFVLLMCMIVLTVCFVRRRAPKRAAEDFFMAPTLSGSESDLRCDGTYHNAQVMTYSGLEPEVAESFNLEDIILKSQSSTSEYETPKCLRET